MSPQHRRARSKTGGVIRERLIECPCGKRVYESKASAERAAKVTPSNGDKAALHAYRCPDGKGWHVGHTVSLQKQNGTSRKRRHG